MPVWRSPAELQEDNELNLIWVELERDVRDDPSFKEIVGIDDATMLAHATDVVKQHFSRLTEDNGAIGLLSPDSWIQLYTMGFVVGARFGRSHPLDKEQT